jgi:hypothetical protein
MPVYARYHDIAGVADEDSKRIVCRYGQRELVQIKEVLQVIGDLENIKQPAEQM